MTLGTPLIEEAKKKGLKNKTAFLMGGVFPPEDSLRLKEIGFDGVFEPGSKIEEIVSFIHGVLSP